MNQDLKDKVVFITGAARGQGNAVAKHFAQEGAHIVAYDIIRNIKNSQYPMATKSELEGLKKICKKNKVECLTFPGDVRDFKSINSAVTEVIKQLGKIDILFNNAGICAYGLSHELSEDEFDTTLDINLKGTWLVGKAIIPQMIKQKAGLIINNASIASHRGMIRLSHYAASKWGLRGLTKSWALELAPYNIRVMSIHPTGVNTDMNKGLARSEGKTEKELAEQSAGNLLNTPWIEVEDVAQAVLYLSKTSGRYLTGSELLLDAGLLCK